MTERLALFPLGTVLFPGLVLPLHVFEDRYRVLVRTLLAERDTERRRFGVVAIRAGSEVGRDAARALHHVGCVAVLRSAEERPDGRFDVVTLGTTRFRLHDAARDPVDGTSRPYLVGAVEPLPDPVGDPAAASRLLPTVASAFGDYLEALGSAHGRRVPRVELPAELVAASYLVAATLRVDVADKQLLLDAPDAVARLTTATALLRREAEVLRRFAAVPAPELARVPRSPN